MSIKMSFDLSARLKNLLLVIDQSDDDESFFEHRDDAPTRPLIEIVAQPNQRSSFTMNPTTAPSLAEQMITTAASIQKSEKQRRTNAQQQRAKKCTFGLKKGFLMKDSKQTRKEVRSSNAKKSQEGVSASNALQKQKNLVFELDSNDSNTTLTSVPNALRSTSNQSSTNTNLLHLPEVQDALLSHFQSAQSRWVSPSFLNSLSLHPTLSKGWNDPRYLAALEHMKTHPKDTMEKLKNDEPEIFHWLMEFLSVIGDHFSSLGEEEDKENNNALQKKDMTAAEPKVREMGPLEEKAMRVLKAQPTHQQHNEGTTADDEEVTKILSNDSLRSILLDLKIQQVMEECARDGEGAGKLQYYMRHDDFGPKLRVLMKAGLLKLA